MNSTPTPGEILVSEAAPGYLSGTIDTIPFTVSGSAVTIGEMTAPHMVAKRGHEDDRSTTSVVDTIGRAQQTTIVNESGLYVTDEGIPPEALNHRRRPRTGLQALRRAYSAPTTLENRLFSPVIDQLGYVTPSPEGGSSSAGGSWFVNFVTLRGRSVRFE